MVIHIVVSAMVSITPRAVARVRLAGLCVSSLSLCTSFTDRPRVKERHTDADTDLAQRWSLLFFVHRAVAGKCGTLAGRLRATQRKRKLPTSQCPLKKCDVFFGTALDHPPGVSWPSQVLILACWQHVSLSWTQLPLRCPSTESGFSYRSCEKAYEGNRQDRRNMVVNYRSWLGSCRKC